jgi:hypothetical protein
MAATEAPPCRLGDAALASAERDARAVPRARRDAANRNLIVKTMITSVVLVLLLLYLMPLGYSIVTSLMSKTQVSDVQAPCCPRPGAVRVPGPAFDV